MNLFIIHFSPVTPPSPFTPTPATAQNYSSVCFSLRRSYQRICACLRLSVTFRNTMHLHGLQFSKPIAYLPRCTTTRCGFATSLCAFPSSLLSTSAGRADALCLMTGTHFTPYSPVVTICTASLTFSNSTFCPPSVFMCFVWI